MKALIPIVLTMLIHGAHGQRAPFPAVANQIGYMVDTSKCILLERQQAMLIGSNLVIDQDHSPIVLAPKKRMNFLVKFRDKAERDSASVYCYKLTSSNGKRMLNTAALDAVVPDTVNDVSPVFLMLIESTPGMMIGFDQLDPGHYVLLLSGNKRDFQTFSVNR